ncbi:hypothetical protein BAUCODRAFT_118789 [Baudoinia panamericana UAMH 10762]|uniref:Inosine/uridine-preferring nucleoside hydrolase domain-containing protein n=1 Tax=Baudoinia panamericana (strain UAMH 10762) TaxID=717646 RepID=M2NNJ8_BAUPA|nr:uncharacterized protein BAUCODRAFT_118789 [Baudoinia panamericana UAMH 10762]EMD01080.1 hypothetical protein BAUCODRAFT_118789 [Baudoinia panamericana UAMH 10762]
MPPRKIILDTDPGIDDILAMLLACSALPEELELVLISVTYGNIDIQNCLRNVVSLFHHIDQELAWREASGKPAGFQTLRKTKPLVAVGPEGPLNDEMLMSDFFHGKDGLAGIHSSHPHLSPDQTWKTLFAGHDMPNDAETAELAAELSKKDGLFRPSSTPAHQEILRLLRENEPDTITIVAIGPLTNLALAAAEDTEVFLRVKEVVVMGGAIHEPGNVRPPPIPLPSAAREPPFRLIKQAPGSIRNALNERNQMNPVAEFNTFADTYAAARVYALTSPNPRTTMPPVPPAPPGKISDEEPPPYLAPYPAKLSRQLKVTLFPIDITEKHVITQGEFGKTIAPLLAAKSPLAEWMSAFMTATFENVGKLRDDVSGDKVFLQLHDPLCIAYCMAGVGSGWQIQADVDMRVETAGQWTKGMCVVDRRSRRRRDDDNEVASDRGTWLSNRAGNRIGICVGTPIEKTFSGMLLKRVIAL